VEGGADLGRVLTSEREILGDHSGRQVQITRLLEEALNGRIIFQKKRKAVCRRSLEGEGGNGKRGRGHVE